MKKNLIKTILLASLPLAMACAGMNESSAAPQQEEISIIPLPAKMERTNTSFTVNKETQIFVQQGSAEALRIAKMLAEKFKKAAGFQIAVAESNGNSIPDNAIYFTAIGADPSLGSEGYQLSANNNSVVVRATEPAGLFYVMQTINQLLPAEIESNTKMENITLQIPGVEINPKVK